MQNAADHTHDDVAELEHVHATAAAYATAMLQRTSPASSLAELNEIHRLKVIEKCAKFGLRDDVTADDRAKALRVIAAVAANWEAAGFTDLFSRVAAELSLDIMEPPSSAVH